MTRIFIILFCSIVSLSCQSTDNVDINVLMTVNGPIDNTAIGITLEHEHVVVDFSGAETVRQPQYEIANAIDSLLPYFHHLKERGVQTLIECTPNYIGRDIYLLKAISDSLDINMITNTGYYAAANKKFLPEHTYTETAEQLANRWIDEWKNGIDGTEIKPGFIKLGVGKDHLDSIEQKIVTAGALSHLQTGLKIAIHTGSAKAANDEIDILEQKSVAPRALIVVHSQNMSSEEQIEIGKRGAWISLDGIRDDHNSQERYCDYLLALKENDLLNQTLISQDAYWSVIQKENGDVGFKKFGSPYSAIFDLFIPKLKAIGFNDAEIDLLLIKNPAEAYKIEVCQVN